MKPRIDYENRRVSVSEQIDMLRALPDPIGFIDEQIKELDQELYKIFSEEIFDVFFDIAGIEDPFSKWFWTQVYTKCYVPDRYRVALKCLDNLKLLRGLIQDKGRARKRVDFERNKDLAKSRPIQSLYPFSKLRKNGRRWSACCPIHNERTPSFVIYDTNTFHCFGCGESGDSIDFVQKIHGYNFQQAVHQLGGLQ